jgi:hypothetical protein
VKTIGEEDKERSPTAHTIFLEVESSNSRTETLNRARATISVKAVNLQDADGVLGEAVEKMKEVLRGVPE